MDKKKLLILTSTFPQSLDDAVTARFVYDLAKSLTSYFKVFVLCPIGRNAKKFEMLEGVEVHRFGYFFPQRHSFLMGGEGILASMEKNRLAFIQIPFLLISEIFNTLLFIRKQKIDIINTHWIVPNGFIFALVKNLSNIPHMMTVHAADIFALKRAGVPGRLLCKYAVKKTDLVLPVSAYIRDCISEVSGMTFKHDIIPMGVDLKKFRSSPAVNKDKFIFLFVGKFVEKKGLKYLLEAASIIKREINGFRVIIVGGGSDESYYKNYAFKLGLEKHIQFCGWVRNDKVGGLYNQSDVLVVPSVFDRKGETEGMPVVILEAMACGIPVISSRISGATDIVKDNYNGLLFKPGDARELADKMTRIYKSGTSSYRQNCIATADIYSTDNLAKKYYEHAVGIMS